MQDTTFLNCRRPYRLRKFTAAPRQIEAAWPSEQWCGVHVVLAVSGGTDSVALLRAMCELKRRHGGPGELQVAHLNHSVRGAEAD